MTTDEDDASGESSEEEMEKGRDGKREQPRWWGAVSFMLLWGGERKGRTYDDRREVR